MTSNQDSLASGSDAAYTGFWTDWDRGKVLGATLTLRDSHAAPLVAAVVILVTIAGGRSWHICRLMWHSLLRSRNSHTRVVQSHRRKQQVVVRNSETAAGATLGLMDEWWTFGVTRVLRECSPKDILLVMFTLGHWALFIALGVLVSQIVFGKVVVSKALPTCGKWFPTVMLDSGEASDESDRIFNELQLNKTINSDNYVRNCYPRGGSEGIVDCNKFMVQYIAHEVDEGQPCPFNASACYPDAKSAVTLTSGNITLSQLGLNTKYGNQISIQRASTCAVVYADMFKTRALDPALGPAGTAAFAFHSDEDTGLDSELVFSMRNQFSEDYKLVAMWLPFKPENISALIRPKSNTGPEVSIFLLQGLGIKFVHETDDYWFSAHQEIEYENVTLPEGWHRYRMDAFLNLITCTESYRWCSSITGKCTEYQGLIRGETLSNIPHGFATLFGKDNSTDSSSEGLHFNMNVLLLETTILESALPYSIQQRGQAAMQASRYLNLGHQIHLLPNQWVLELEYWFMMALARLQLEILNTVDRPVNLDASVAANMWAEEKYKGLLKLCGTIKFRSPYHTSLSAFGLIMILVFCGVLMLGSGTGAVLSWLPWTRKWKSAVEWKRDEVLALLEGTKEQSSLEEVREVDDMETVSVTIGDDKIRRTGQRRNDEFDPFLMND